MLEGPSIVILKEEAKQFEGKKTLSVTGNAKIDLKRLEEQTVCSFRSWGKHFLICYQDFTVRIHLLMFGTYRINETKNAAVRLGLKFKNGEINFYTCAVKLLEGDINSHYDWSEDVMNEQWNPENAKSKLELTPHKPVCDALLEQDIFSGVGNIIKNEVLYRIYMHPESVVGRIPSEKIDELITEARTYSFQFLNWKKQGILKKHWLAHSKECCRRCDLNFTKKYTGTKKRRSFFCENCQILYT